MNSRPRLLDLFCGGGGCARGYHLAGFQVDGVDLKPQPRYLLPGAVQFIQADALEFVRQHGHEYDAIHASPPCQAYTQASWKQGNRKKHPALLEATREALDRTDRPWIIENVSGAPMQPPAIQLCGLFPLATGLGAD